jgi:hypothetical protein
VGWQQVAKGCSDESAGFGQKDVPQLQGNQAQRRGARDLQKSAPQAASGLILD